MAKHLIIFGAGASFGSDTTGTPPLGGNLFEALVSFNPSGWGKVCSEQVELFREDFEEGMKNLSLKNPHAMPPLQRAMAAYFFNFIPTRSNLYIKFVEKIKNQNLEGAMATLNYERLLELSLSFSGIRPVVGRKAEANSEIEVCFPHGCCHLFCQSVRGAAQGISFSGTAVSTNGPVKVIADLRQFQERINNDAFPPVMSYFEPSKITTSGASFIKNQRKRFVELVSESSTIGIIGLRVRPRDEHIWQPLARTSGKIVYCSGRLSGEEFKTWAGEARPHNTDIVLPHYFSDGFEKLCSSIGLI